jgi:tryptophan-rich sensory protein
MKKFIKLVASIFFCQLAGIIGSVFTVSAIPGWYETINRPVITPPNWLFGPVWITLYTLMGIALYMIWQEGLKKRDVKFAFIFFIIHLAVNASWSIIFFGFNALWLSVSVILVLLVMIIASIILFWDISRIAALLLVPYLLWVTYATALNVSIAVLN